MIKLYEFLYKQHAMSNNIIDDIIKGLEDKHKYTYHNVELSVTRTEGMKEFVDLGKDTIEKIIMLLQNIVDTVNKNTVYISKINFYKSTMFNRMLIIKCKDTEDALICYIKLLTNSDFTKIMLKINDGFQKTLPVDDALKELKRYLTNNYKYATYFRIYYKSTSKPN